MSQDHPSILIVDDEDVVRDSLFHWFQSEEYNVEAATNAADALRFISERPFDVVIADIRMPGMDGLQLLERIRAEELDTAVIVITGYASVETAIRALKHGAFDYVTKPFDPDDLSISVRNAIAQLNLKRENSNLRAQLRESERLTELVGQSDSIRKVREQIATAAGVDSTVLITGESGTGKELVTRAIHSLSSRAAGPMVVAHCGALAETLIESELFGHERGAFTGAQFRKKGKFEAAAHGTIFLDEIADISLKTQTDLLRVLQEHEIVRVGGTQPIHIDFRVIAATNKDLGQMAREGLFRPDLFYRLNVINIHVPPLRERHGDVPLLAMHFLEKFNKQMNRKLEGFEAASLDRLSSYHWPGNVRELENIIERAVVVGREPLIRAKDLAITGTIMTPADRSLATLERNYIAQVLEECNWNQSQSARVLGIDRITLYHKIRRYGFQSPKARNHSSAAVTAASER
jgi:DNA-binding NtrC family response regulator